ncbi:hypothetical protein ACLMJK_003713 [Lecanora helva]
METLKPEASLADYSRPGTRLGSGGQGSVYRYIYAPTGALYAAKVLEYDEEFRDDGRPSNVAYILRERMVVQRFAHAHLIKAVQVFEYPTGVVIIMPLFPRGNMRKLSLEPRLLKDAVRQILEALRHLHEQGYIHRDIKPENVLVRNKKGDPLDLVVADYGLTTFHKPVTVCGSHGYMAPEIVFNHDRPKSQAREYPNSVDIYALGILILQKLGLPVPMIPIRTRAKLRDNIQPLIDEAQDKCGPGDDERHYALLTAGRMLHFDAYDRPSADECLRSPWFTRSVESDPPLQLSRTFSNHSIVESLSGLSVAKPGKDWWNSTQQAGSPRHQVQNREGGGGRYPSRKRKQIDRFDPIRPPNKRKAQKPHDSALLTPGPTPERDRQGQEPTPGAISPHKSPAKSEESPAGAMALSWDKIESSE